MFANDHVGMWSTADGAVRKLLLPNGRYLALIAGGEIRHQGEYRVIGARIEYFDDEGKTGVGLFEDGVMIGATGVPLYPKDMWDEEAASIAIVAAPSTSLRLVPLPR